MVVICLLEKTLHFFFRFDFNQMNELCARWFFSDFNAILCTDVPEFWRERLGDVLH